MRLFQCAIAGKMCIFPTFILIRCIVSLCALFGVTAAGDELSCGLFFASEAHIMSVINITDLTFAYEGSYDNILEWLYSLCETIGGSANVRLDGNALKCDLFSGTDRSLLQDDNPHIVFSDAYNNLLSFSYAADDAVQKNFAYVLGCGEGNARKRTTFCSSAEPTYLDRYEVYVDERNTAQEEDVTDAEYLEILKSSGAEHLVQPKTASESAIAAFSTQYQYNKDYFVGDYVTVEQRRFGLIQPRIQLIGMVESFDQNGRSLTPTFKETE